MNRQLSEVYASLTSMKLFPDFETGFGGVLATAGEAGQVAMMAGLRPGNRMKRD